MPRSASALATETTKSEKHAPRANWRRSLKPGELTLTDLLNANSLPILPRAQRDNGECREQIDDLKSTIEADGSNLGAIPAPVIHQDSGRVLDGSTTVIPAIVAWAHETHPGAGSGITIPVLFHTGDIMQAVSDVMYEDATRGIKRTAADRATALKAFLEATVAKEEDPPSANALAETFRVHKKAALKLREDICGRQAFAVGRDGKRYSAARDLVAAAANRVSDTRLAGAGAATDTDGEEIPDATNDETVAVSEVEDVVGDLEPYAAAEAAVGELLTAIKRFITLNTEATKRDKSPLAYISDELFFEAKTSISTLTTLWRFARRD